MKNDLRIAVTKRMMKEALLELLASKPLSKIKVNELCEKSGVNRATFYRHYETLQDILQDIEADFIKQLPMPDKPPQTIEEVHENLKIVCTYLYMHSDMLKLLFLNKSDSDMIHGMNTFYRNFLETCREDIPLKKMDEDSIQLVIALLCGGGQCLLRKWILDDIHKTPDEIATILCNIIRWPESYEMFLNTGDKSAATP